jgi:hypothetical protein
MSRLTTFVLDGDAADADGYEIVNAIFGGMIDTTLVGEPVRDDLYWSVRPHGRYFWVADFNHCHVADLMAELAAVGWNFPANVTLFVRSEEASQWAMFRLDMDAPRWVTVVPPMVWSGGEWTEARPSAADGPKWW